MSVEWKKILRQIDTLTKDLEKKMEETPVYSSVHNLAYKVLRDTQKVAEKLEMIEKDSWEKYETKRLFGARQWKVATILLNNYKPKQEFSRKIIIDKCKSEGIEERDALSALYSLFRKGILERFGRGSTSGREDYTFYRMTQEGYETLMKQKKAIEESRRKIPID